jgi:hypothetical protein
MKILKYGEGYPKTVVCDNCKSELEYNSKDIYSRTDALDEFITTGIITCPVCGKTVVVFQHSHPRLDLIKKKWWWER